MYTKPGRPGVDPTRFRAGSGFPRPGAGPGSGPGRVRVDPGSTRPFLSLFPINHGRWRSYKSWTRRSERRPEPSVLEDCLPLATLAFWGLGTTFFLGFVGGQYRVRWSFGFHYVLFIHKRDDPGHAKSTSCTIPNLPITR